MPAHRCARCWWRSTTGSATARCRRLADIRAAAAERWCRLRPTTSASRASRASPIRAAWRGPPSSNPNEMPPSKGAAYPVFVPKTDADGRDLAGVQSADAGSASGNPHRLEPAQNRFWRRRVVRQQRRMISFATTREERLKNNDPRLSMAERYPKPRRPRGGDCESGATTGKGPAAAGRRRKAVRSERQLKRFRAKWMPVRVKKTRQNKKIRASVLIQAEAIWL